MSVFESFGLSYITFVSTVKSDFSIITKSGRLGFVIGIGSFVLLVIVTSFVSTIVKKFVPIDAEFERCLLLAGGLESGMSFLGIFDILTEMKLLNSELGRLALSSSFINCTLAMAMGGIFILQSEVPNAGIESISLLQTISFVLIATFIVYVFRPVIFWMMRQTPEGKPLKNDHMLAMHLMVLASSFVSESMGLTGFWGPVLLGVVIPLIPPMGPLLTDRIETFVWSVFKPCFLINVGRGVNMFSFTLTGFLLVELVIWVATTMKFFAIIIPSFYYKIPFMDALSLGFLLNSRSIYDIQMYTRTIRQKMTSDEVDGIMVMTALLKSAIALPLLRGFYDTSRRYVAYRRRTIQHNRHDAELRILACIHEDNNFATIINFLGASDPPPQSRVCLHVLNLEEYVGQSLHIVISHRLDRMPSAKPTKVDLMLNAFRQFDQQSSDNLSVQCFTAITPSASMHEDICLVAFEKCISLVIIPLQKTNNYFIKKMVKNVLKMAPCSVGLLLDRGEFMDSRLLFTHRLEVNVCVIFIGGCDDREALAYGGRMAADQNVTLTIIRFFAVNHINKNLMEEKLDLKCISDLRLSTIDNKNVKYSIHSVEEGSETLRVINSAGNDFDLMLTGRRHDHHSPMLSGLAEWSKIEEWGVIGDILASSDFPSNASVMVVQQQASVVEDMVIESPRFVSKHPK